MKATLSALLAGALALAGTSVAQDPGRTPIPSTERPRLGTPTPRGAAVSEEWSEEPQQREREWRSMLDAADYLRALEVTGMAASLSQGGAKATKGTGAWTSTGPVGGFGAKGDNGRVAGLQLVRIGTTDWIYAGASSGGLWRSPLTSGGVWTALGDALPNPAVRAFAVHPTDPQRIVVGTGDYYRYKGAGMYLSVDGGATWSTVSPTFPPSHCHRILHSLDDPQVMLAGSDEGLLRSTDAGSSWTEVEGGNFTDLVLHPTDPDILYAVSASIGVYRSLDKGVSWTRLTSPQLPPIGSWGRGALAICRDVPDNVAMAVESGGNVKGVYRTTDGGTTWSDVTSDLGSSFGSAQARHVLSLAFRPTDGDELLLGVDTIARSYWDAGSATLKWQVGEGPAGFTIGHADITQLVFSALTGDDVLWICNDGGLYAHDFVSGITGSFNGNTTTGLVISQVDCLDADRSMQVLGLQDNGVLRTESGGASWTRLLTGDGGHGQIIDPEHFDAWFWAGAPWYPARGIFGQSVEVLPDPGLSHYFLHVPGTSRVWAGGAQTVYSAAAYGSPVTWNVEKTGGLHPQPTAALRRLWGNPLESGTLYLTFGNDWDGDISVTRKVGSTWTVNSTSLLPVGVFGWIESATPSSEWPGECWVGCQAPAGQPKIFHTTDYGATWQDLTGTLSAVGAVFRVVPEPFDPLKLYVATDLGIFRSVDGGQSWQPFQDGMPIVEVRGLEFVVDDAHGATHKLRAATFGRGTWVRDVAAAPIVYVDKSNSGSEDGTYEHPYNTVAEGVAAAPAGAIVAIRSNTYDEPQVLTKGVKLMTYMDPSVIR